MKSYSAASELKLKVYTLRHGLYLLIRIIFQLRSWKLLN